MLQDRTTSQQGGCQMPTAGDWRDRLHKGHSPELHLNWAWGNGYTFLFGRPFQLQTQEGTLAEENS